MFKFEIRAFILLSMLAALPRPVFAIAECEVSASGVGFGVYDVFTSSPTDAAGNVSVSCSLLGLLSLLVSYDIRLSAGTSGTYSTRTMAGAGNSLAYNLYKDSARNSIWGDGSSGTQTVSDGYLLGLLTVTRHYPVYGRIPPNQNVSPGSYLDTIFVTVIY
jgi:spore coat protein U-like protein